jgi:hypothetical protein
MEVITDLPGFLKIIIDLKKNSAENLLLFRGQREEHPLKPKIGRKSITASREKEIFEEFKRRAVPIMTSVPETDWDWLTFAQHHGLSTRFLDWTENPLVALFFAIKKSFISRQVNHVYVIDARSFMIHTPHPRLFPRNEVDSFSPFDITEILIVKPNRISDRLIAQAGWFSVHPFDKKTMQFSSIEKDRQLMHIRIECPSPETMKKELDMIGTNTAALFPDLDGLCSFLNWRHNA